MKLGIYKHYKGNMYEVIAEGLDSDSDELVIIYKPLYKTDVIREDMFFVRSKKIFLEKILIDGKMISRFEFVK